MSDPWQMQSWREAPCVHVAVADFLLRAQPGLQYAGKGYDVVLGSRVQLSTTGSVYFDVSSQRPTWLFYCYDGYVKVLRQWHTCATAQFEYADPECLEQAVRWYLGDVARMETELRSG